MNTAYLLIILLFPFGPQSGQAVSYVPFGSLATCQAAASTVHQQTPFYARIRTICAKQV